MKDNFASDHAALRRLQRGDCDNDRTLTEVWDEAVPCEVKYKSYDEARIDFIEDLILLRKDDEIVTVLNRGGEDVTIEVETDDDVSTET